MSKSRKTEPTVVGSVYGRLVVLEQAEDKRYPTTKQAFRQWACQCECGTIKTIVEGGLRNGNTRSCGCLHRECTAIAKSKPATKTYVSSTKRGAELRGLAWELTDDEAYAIMQRDCVYCGAVPRSYRAALTRPVIRNGIDRVDNDVGYVLENCVPCCWDCNAFKRALSVEKFDNLIKKIYQFRGLGLCE